MTKEIINIHIGQAGVQISNAIWELFCVEHGLDCNGNIRTENAVYLAEYFPGLNTIFQEGQTNKYMPRAINLDLEPTVLDEVRQGPYRNLWHPDMLINGIEDAANNFARGYFSIGKRKISEFISQLTKLVRDCDCLHGFVIVNSYGGGTGSGFSNLVLDYMNDELAKNTKIGMVVFPSPIMSTAVVEPYNCLLSATTSIDNIDLALLFDNEAIFESCYTKMNIPKPTYSNVNRILSQVLSSLTVTLRFGSCLDHDLAHLQTNLVPYPQMHFPFVNFSPLCDQSKVEHKTLSTTSLTHDLFDEGNQLIKCDVTLGKYMACCLHYRGLILPKEINLALKAIKERKNVQFVDWCPTGFKVGISSMPPSVIGSQLGISKKNCSMFCNSSAIEQVWHRINSKFNDLYRKKSFIHWYYGEGMESLEFEQMREKITNLQRDYLEVTEATRSETEQKVIIKSKLQKNINSELNFNSNNEFISAREKSLSGSVNNSIDSSISNSQISIERRNEIRYLLKKMNSLRNNLDEVKSKT